jgi:hypothetical protein
MQRQNGFYQRPSSWSGNFLSGISSGIGNFTRKIFGPRSNQNMMQPQFQSNRYDYPPDNTSAAQSVYGGKKGKKSMKKGGSNVVPYSEDVWTRQGSFPSAVGGGKRMKKSRKSKKSKKGGNLTRRRDGGSKKSKTYRRK